MSIYITEPAPEGTEDQRERTLKPLFSEKKNLWGCVRVYPDGRAVQIKNSPLCDTEDQAVEWLMGFAEKNGLQVFAVASAAEGDNEAAIAESDGDASTESETEPEPEPDTEPDTEPITEESESLNLEQEPIGEAETDDEPEPTQTSEFSPAAQHTRAVLSVVSAARKQLEELAISCSVEKMSIDGDAVTIKFGTSRPEHFTSFMSHMKTQIFLMIFPAQGKLPFDIEETAAKCIADQQPLPLPLDGPMPDKPASLRETETEPEGDVEGGDEIEN